MACPVCKSNDVKTINDVFSISRHEIDNMINNKRFHFEQIDLKYCASCGVLRI